MRVRVKICCISSLQEARAAANAGADALGLVGDMPSGPGVIDDNLVREIALATPPPIASVLLTSRTRGADIVDHTRYCGTSVVQIVRHIEPAEYSVLIREMPRIKRIQVVHVEGEAVFDLLEIYSPFVDAFLLDSGRPTIQRPELGGTGRVHDWAISAEFVRRTDRPVFLAGGLTPENAMSAIQTVRPYGVDLCTGVRTSGNLDIDKLANFMRIARTTEVPR